jgi:hypothetical protein
MELKTYALERRAAIHEASRTIAAINFGIPIIRVTIADGQPHLHRGTYRQQRDLAVESLVILCLAGPAGEELICGAVDDGDDRIDVDAARRYLRDDYPTLRSNTKCSVCGSLLNAWSYRHAARLKSLRTRCCGMIA